MHKVTIDELIEIFGEVVDVYGINIDTNSVLGEDFPLDSREMLRILSRIESRYQFRFEPKEVLSLKTPGGILKIVQHHIDTE